MRDLPALFAYLMATLANLLGPDGAEAVIAESILLKHQLLIIKRARRRAPNLCVPCRGCSCGSGPCFCTPRRVLCSSVILKPATWLRFHTAIKMHEHRL